MQWDEEGRLQADWLLGGERVTKSGNLLTIVMFGSRRSHVFDQDGKYSSSEPEMMALMDNLRAL